MDDFWVNAVFSVTPTIIVGLIFWFVMRAIVRADRSERSSYSRVEAEERKRLGLVDEPIVSDPVVPAVPGTASAAEPTDKPA